MADSPVTRQGTTWMDWIGVATGVLALMVSFLPWYRLTVDLVPQAEARGVRPWLTVWESNFLAWFPIVLLLTVTVLLLWQRFGKPVPMIPSLWLTLALLAVVMILLRWITLPEGLEAGYGLYLGLMAGVLSGIAGFLAFRGQERATSAA